MWADDARVWAGPWPRQEGSGRPACARSLAADRRKGTGPQHTPGLPHPVFTDILKIKSREGDNKDFSKEPMGTHDVVQPLAGILCSREGRSGHCSSAGGP